MNEERLC